MPPAGMVPPGACEGSGMAFGCGAALTGAPFAIAAGFLIGAAGALETAAGFVTG